MTAVHALGKEPRPDGVRKLIASGDTYRILIGDCRIIYNIFDTRFVIEIIKVRDRKEACT